MKITLATLESATPQQVFDQVSTHLLTQMERSTNIINGMCQYRATSGLKCAVGCLISDDEYRPDMETNSWVVLQKDFGIPIAHEGLINHLQKIHDSYEPGRWEKKLRALAGKANLQCNFSIGE